MSRLVKLDDKVFDIDDISVVRDYNASVDGMYYTNADRESGSRVSAITMKSTGNSYYTRLTVDNIFELIQFFDKVGHHD